jgi:hypothetical protein
MVTHLLRITAGCAQVMTDLLHVAARCARLLKDLARVSGECGSVADLRRSVARDRGFDAGEKM